MKTIILSAAAAKDLDALPNAAREQVSAALEAYALWGRGDIKKLGGREGCRLRIGRCRVLFDEDAQTILALYVGKRETQTYRRN
jgi:mRNA interferase RelE/StbE